MAKGKGTGKAPKAVVAQRFNRVLELVRDGHRFTKVRSIVAADAAREAKERKEAKSAKKPENEPVFCWGDSGKVAERTLVRYWKRAHVRLIEDGQKLVKMGDLLVARNVSRQDAIYILALEAGRYEVCRKIIQDQLTLFGLNNGAVTARLSAFDQQPTGEEEVPDIGTSDRPLPEIVEEQMSIFNVARARRGLPPLPGVAKLAVVAGGAK